MNESEFVSTTKRVARRLTDDSIKTNVAVIICSASICGEVMVGLMFPSVERSVRQELKLPTVQ